MAGRDISLQFRFLGRELEIQGFLYAETSVSRVIDILTIPCERKKWDLRLVDMQAIPDGEGYIFTYLSERTLYEFHTSITKIINSNGNGSVEFKTTCYEFKQRNSILGNFNSLYVIEIAEELPSSTNDSDEKVYFKQGEASLGRVKVTWSSHFCEASYALVRGDVFQEADVLKKSFELFISTAEHKNGKFKKGNRESSVSSLVDACERKKLRRTFTFDNIVSPLSK